MTVLYLLLWTMCLIALCMFCHLTSCSKKCKYFLSWDNIVGIDRMPGKINKYGRKDTMEMDWESCGKWMDGKGSSIEEMTIKEGTWGSCSMIKKMGKDLAWMEVRAMRGFALTSGNIH